MKIELIGQIWGSLKVVEDLGVLNKNRKVKCVCDCGNSCEVYLNNLKKGNTRSCGCLSKTLRKLKWEDIYEKRGFKKKSQSCPEYLAWRNMLSRCYNKKDISFKSYGARGIEVCEEWCSDFEKFLSDVGVKPAPNYSLDRYNVNKNYTRENVFWREPYWQARNKGKRVDTTSRFKGVSLGSGKWRARIKDSNGLQKHLGMFSDEKEAAQAVDAFLLNEFGQNCPWTNERLGLFLKVIGGKENASK